MLAVESLTKTYAQGHTKVHALRDLSFELTKGQTLAVVGSSGSGKTTLLSLLGGLDTPSEGKVTIADEVISSMTELELSEFRSQNMGIVFQQFHLMPYMTALENVSLPLEITKSGDILSRARKALASVGLESRMHHRPDQLSGGECQRVAIARALVIEPKVLLADEPRGNLDTETGEVIMELLFRLVAENQMTMVLVTHNPDHASLCQNQIQLKAGRRL